jgi:FkbM family methyltransferase
MPKIATNSNPSMTRHLVDRGVFQSEPVTVVDVGSRGGFNVEWSAFGSALRIVGFEPEESECARLNAGAPPNVTYLPVALAGHTGSATFYETQLSASSGLYRTNMQYFSRLLNRENAVVVGERTIAVSTLDEALARAGVDRVDFVKLDAEGAELDILTGSPSLVGSSTLIGLLSEFRFQQEINGSPIFWQLDAQVRDFGFRLYDMGFSHQSRRALPYESLPEFESLRYQLLPHGLPFFAYTSHGQIMDGDALYFRDWLIECNAPARQRATPVRLLKTAAFFELYSLNDCAAELIEAHRHELAPLVDCDRLLDLLTPPFKGRSLDYKAYMSAFFDSEQATAAPEGAMNPAAAWTFPLLSQHIRGHLEIRKGISVVCYGAGTDFLRLLDDGAFQHNPVIAVVDNHKCSGTSVGGVRVVREAELDDLCFEVIVATAARVGPELRAQAALWSAKSSRLVSIV